MHALVRDGVEARVGATPDGLSKRELLQRLPVPHDAFEIGTGVKAWGEHPVLRAVSSAPNPASLLSRWQSIEAFGHTSHRTRTVFADERRVELEHVSLDGGPISAVQDLLIWGVVAGLFELWGATHVVLEWPDGGRFGAPRDQGTTRTVSVHLGRSKRAQPPGIPKDTPSMAAVQAVVQTDLLHSWVLREVAARLRVSDRSLQRRLRAEAVTFSSVLQRTRVDAAVKLLRSTELGLTEIAFCTGFSDHAHLTRTTRKHMELPPSGLRALLRASSSQQD